MAELKDRYHEFRIACQILKVSVAQKASEWDVTPQAVMYAARAANRSPRLRELIDETIKEAQEVIPFKYPEEGLKETGT